LTGVAPPLVHRSLVLGVRTLVTAFEWTATEVRGVAFLLYEHGHLTREETGWLAGYVAADAPKTFVDPAPLDGD
jgi:hypothetical protein